MFVVHIFVGKGDALSSRYSYQTSNSLLHLLLVSYDVLVEIRSVDSRTEDLKAEVVVLSILQASGILSSSDSSQKNC
jgi:hypothetical protein